MFHNIMHPMSKIDENNICLLSLINLKPLPNANAMFL